MSALDKAKAALDDMVEKMPEAPDMLEVRTPFVCPTRVHCFFSLNLRRLAICQVLEKLEERTPFVNVFLQEIERLAILQVASLQPRISIHLFYRY
jgi:hypothetical protein